MGWFLGDGKTQHAPSGHSADSAAARSASAHPPMNPQGTNVLQHTLARMLPLKRWQSQVYRLAEKYPPGLDDGYTPIWEVANFTLPARQTTQARINFQREFCLIAISASSSQAGGFRAQIYDQKAKRRLADRGVNFANYFGAGSSPLFLREPYLFLPDSTGMDAQALIVVQNQDTGGSNNIIQVVLYGQARRFNWPD